MLDLFRKGIVQVNRGSPLDQERGTILNYMLVATLILFVCYGLMGLVFNPDAHRFIMPFAIGIIVVVPAFYASKTGHSTFAILWAAFAMSVSLCASLIFSVIYEDTTEILLPTLVAMCFSIALITPLENGQSLGVILICNSILTSLLFAVWRTRFPSLGQPDDIEIFVLAPISFNSLLALGLYAVQRRRKALRRQVEKAHELLFTILANIPVGVAVYDYTAPAKGTVPLLMNDLLPDLIGPMDDTQERIHRELKLLSEAKIDGQSNESRYTNMAQNRPWLQAAFRESSYEPSGYVTLSLDDEEWYVQEQARLVRDENQQLKYVIYSAFNVTDYLELIGAANTMLSTQSATQQAHQAANRIKSSVLSVIGHDLRTPLNTILTRITVMEREHQGGFRVLDEQTRKDLTTLFKAADDAQSQVNNLLEAARLENDKMELDRKPRDIRLIISSIMEIMTSLFDQENISHSLLQPDTPVVALVDETRLRQVVYNLLSNALKFTRDGGRIGVVVTLQETDARISVSDTGIGIPEQKLEEIFNRFEQLGIDVETRKSGLGLGLYIARSLVAMHGGRLWVESKVGMGSTFHFTLPLAPPGTQPLPSPSTRSGSSSKANQQQERKN